jgi:hypothetical protein
LHKQIRKGDHEPDSCDTDYKGKVKERNSEFKIYKARRSVCVVHTGIAVYRPGDKDLGKDEYVSA